MSKISPARKSAFEILKKIIKEKAFSSVLLPIYEDRLEIKDRALCHELVLGILRKQIYLDKIIEKLTGKDLKKFDPEVIVALRLGIYQLLYLDKIPDYSAINESVNLVKVAKKKSASGLVNAVLRRVSREKNFEFEFVDSTEKISIETSHPRWLIENWIEQFGIEETEKITIANNETPKSAFRFTQNFYNKDAETQKNILNELEKIGVFRSEIVEDCFIAEKFNSVLFELVEKGLIYFQEEASQMIGQMIGLKDNESFFDVCAAPGSKTTGIARQKTKGKRQKVFVAGDFYSHRIKILKLNCKKQGVDFVEFVRFDAENPLPFPYESFDVILVDAPCSGTGTIRHNPEIRYFLQKEDFAELSNKQLRILQNASKLVKRGGRIIYSTCSLERIENEGVIEKFLEESNFKVIPPDLPNSFLTNKSFGRTFPNRDGIDGFFFSLFEKR
jgi:16S rRNA (cytosine967-C5)-methyltransferase